MVFCRGFFILAPIKVDVSSRNVLAVCHRNVVLGNTAKCCKQREGFLYNSVCVSVLVLPKARDMSCVLWSL